MTIIRAPTPGSRRGQPTAGCSGRCGRACRRPGTRRRRQPCGPDRAAPPARRPRSPCLQVGLRACGGTGRGGPRRAGCRRPGRGSGDVVDVVRGGDDLERGAASVADQMVFAARLPPVDRRRTGVGPPFACGCGSHPRTLVTSRVRPPRSAPQAGPGAAGRKHLPPATGPDDASTSDPSRTPAPAAAVARLLVDVRPYFVQGPFHPR